MVRKIAVLLVVFAAFAATALGQVGTFTDGDPNNDPNTCWDHYFATGRADDCDWVRGWHEAALAAGHISISQARSMYPDIGGGMSTSEATDDGGGGGMLAWDAYCSRPLSVEEKMYGDCPSDTKTVIIETCYIVWDPSKAANNVIGACDGSDGAIEHRTRVERKA